MLRYWVFGLVLTLLTGHVYAIDDVTNTDALELGETYTVENGGLTFSYPDKWIVIEGQGVVIVASRQEVLETSGPNDLTSGDLILFLYPSVRNLPNYPQNAALAETVPDSIVSFYSTIGGRLGYEQQGEFTAPKIGDGSRIASSVTALAPEDAHERLVMAMEDGGGDVVTVFAFTQSGEMGDFNSTIEAIMASVQLDSI